MASEDDVAARYRWSAEHEFAGHSDLYAAWARDVAGDDRLVALLAALPDRRSQPHLVFAAARWGGIPLDGSVSAARWLRDHWDVVVPTVLTRSTQTNEAARCGPMLPLLSQMKGPLALIELGASAGLCLVPDRYAYRFEQGTEVVTLGDGDPVISCQLTGIAAPTRMPEIVWRAGIDLAPIDPLDPDARAWLETLVWPGQDDRLDRLRRALATVARDPVRIVRGDLVEALPALAAEAPSDATLVVIHSAVLNYLPVADRRAAVRAIRATGARWISQEGVRVIDEVHARLPESVGEPARYVLALDGEPVAVTGFHGGSAEAL